MSKVGIGSVLLGITSFYFSFMMAEGFFYELRISIDVCNTKVIVMNHVHFW